MIQKICKKRNKGITIIEILISVAVMVSFMGSLYLALVLYIKIATAGPMHTSAVFLMDEGMEAVRTIRNESWTNIEDLGNNIPYWLFFDNNTWKATTTEQIVDGKFSVYFILEEANRDGDGKISNVGTVCSDTRKVIVFTEWEGLLGSSSVDVSGYVINIFE